MEKSYPGCRDCVREAYRLKNVPPETADIMISSLTKSSMAQYNSGLSKWWSYCTTSAIDPYGASKTQVLAFLMEEFNKGLSYSSLNCYRSAIGLLYGPDLGEDPLVKRFFNGVAKERPPEPRYNSTWDPKLVLDEISKWGKNEDMTQMRLSQKVALLLPLVTSNRLQTVGLINIENIENKGDYIEIKIPDRIKTTKESKPQPTLILPFYKNDISICPAVALLAYIEKTKLMRGSEQKLFIAC